MECACAALYRVTSEAVSRKLRRTCVLHMQWCLPLGGDAHEGFSNGAELRCLCAACLTQPLRKFSKGCVLRTSPGDCAPHVRAAHAVVLAPGWCCP